MEVCKYDSRKFFLFWIRVFFGIWLLYAGLFKWVMMKPAAFVGMITSQFDPTWSPHFLNVGLAWLILVSEPALALWVLSGKHARKAWMATSLLMYLLTLGQTLLMKPEVTANWQYLVLTLACAALSDPDPAG